MKRTCFLILIGISSILMFSCSQEKKVVTVEDFAELSATYVANIKAFEGRINPTDFNSFQQIKDSIRIEKMTGDSVLSALYTSIKDTVFLSFTQSENIDKIAIQDVWIVDADYNQLFLEARVKALDNSALRGPYTSLSAFDSEGKRLDVGGGIGGPTDTKLQAGEVYTFTGKIDKIHLLHDFNYLQFDEKIKKW
ncbi:MAG: hypothetical protein PF481_03310 [Bacteroidales bacterium]|jgi:hypothetical protein|nr:hypothetical protein [Bacteroidales bacterium]